MPSREHDCVSRSGYQKKRFARLGELVFVMCLLSDGRYVMSEPPSTARHNVPT